MAEIIMGKRDRNERRGVRRQFDEREARKQADRMENDGLDQGGDFNIWYVYYFYCVCTTGQ